MRHFLRENGCHRRRRPSSSYMCVCARTYLRVCFSCGTSPIALAARPAHSSLQLAALIFEGIANLIENGSKNIGDFVLRKPSAGQCLLNARKRRSKTSAGLNSMKNFTALPRVRATIHACRDHGAHGKSCTCFAIDSVTVHHVYCVCMCCRIAMPSSRSDNLNAIAVTGRCNIMQVQ